MVNDPTSDFLTRIRNIKAIGGDAVEMPHSGFKEEIAKALLKEGFLGDIEVKGKTKKVLSFKIVHEKDGSSKFENLERVSKLSRRMYKGYRDIKPVKFGHGLMILSTPKGIMTDKEAKKEKVGGEALFKIW